MEIFKGMGNTSPSQIRSKKVLLSPRPLNGRQGPRNMFQALSPFEKKLLSKSWKSLRAKRELAISMFADVLTQKPELKLHLGIENLDNNQILVSEALYEHANKFMGFLGTVVDSLNDQTMHEGVSF